MIDRSEALEALAGRDFEVLVIGGGVTGAGVALDAASRGYSVAIVERGDWASGTSSRSSKMVHGGLRYLQSFDLGLVREALLERQLLVKLAPHLVWPCPFVVPAFDGDRPDRLIGMGLNMYDVLATTRSWGRGRGQESWSPARHRTITGEEVVATAPALAERGPTSGYLFYDCQTDDSRMVLTILGEAERYGAVGANRASVCDLLEEDGRATGVVCIDGESGEQFAVNGKNVVNATGAWADTIRPAEFREEEGIPSLRPSRGSHVIVPRETLPLNGGVIVPAGEGRSIFALPWLGSTLIGTTDNDYDGDMDHPKAPVGDVDYILSAVNDFFGTHLGYGDMAGTFAGIRPLVSTGDPKKSVDISRHAELYETSSGLITITGGKLTTWRRMAKMTVDRIAERQYGGPPCRTEQVPLGRPVKIDDLPDVEGVTRDQKDALARRYGYAAHQVLALAAEKRELAEPILPGKPDLLAEAPFSARHEQARTPADVLLRRTRLGLTEARRIVGGDSSVPGRVARAMGAELGWDGPRCDLEVERWNDAAAAEGLVFEPE